MQILSLCLQAEKSALMLRKGQCHLCTTTPSSRFIQIPEAKIIAIITIYRAYRIPLLALSSLPLNPPTPVALLELLELPLRCLLASSGLVGCSPLARANKFNMSVRLTTPESRPDMCRPGSADAETEGVVDKG